VRTKRTTQ